MVYNPNLPPPPLPFKTLKEAVKCDKCGNPAYTKVNLPDKYQGFLCDNCFKILPYPYNECRNEPATGESVANKENTDKPQDPEDLFKEGQCYFCGDGVEKNKEKALELFTAAAEMGHTEAQYNVGLCHQKGIYGKALDWKQAVFWMEKAAIGGYTEAAYRLGKLYIDAINGPAVKDYKKAVEWLTRAADAGHEKALNDLGKCYAEGKGAEQDFKKAEKLWKEASDKNNAEAKENLQILKRNKKIK